MMESEISSGSKKRKGGAQQRMGRVAEDLQVESALQLLLMTYLAQGLISGCMVHEISQAAFKDLDMARQGYSLPALEKMAKLAQGKNLVRQVYTELARTASLPRAFSCMFPYKDGNHPASVLLPHEMFAAFFANQAFWALSILPSKKKLQEWWSKFDSHPTMTNHPIRKKPNYKTMTIPLQMHGDEVPVQGIGKIWSRSCLIFSWCSLVANAAGAKLEDIMFFIYGVFEKILCSNNFNFGWHHGHLVQDIGLVVPMLV